jgi:hypothetical protein
MISRQDLERLARLKSELASSRSISGWIHGYDSCASRPRLNSKERSRRRSGESQRDGERLLSEKVLTCWISYQLGNRRGGG